MIKDLWIALLILGILFLILSLFLSLYWRVFNLLDEVSGRKARRQIAKLREYNNSTGEITSVNTEEMELVLAGGGTLMQSSSSRSNSTGKSLRDMIDDPYGSVGKDTIATSSPIPRVPRSEEDLESPTGILEDADFGSSNKQNIVILDEQSSLQEEDV